MAKIKGMNKTMVALGLSAMMLLGSATTAFAYTEETPPAETETQEQVLEENQINTEDAFTDPGNGQLQDDITNSESKEFLTITTKNNQTFYVVIDRSSNTDNVYMLSKVDENDLKEFLEEAPEDEKPTTDIVLEENVQTETESTTPEVTEQDDMQTSSANPALLGVLGLAVAGVAGFGYMKFFKSKKDDDDDTSEGMEIAGENDTTDQDEESSDFDA